MRAIVLILVAVNLLSFSEAKPKKAKMRIIVINAEEQTVEGAKIVVYGSHDEYEKEVNPVASGTTNAKGYAEFKGLEEKKYYLHIEKGHANNHHSHNETDILRLKGKNRFEIEIDE
jgi:hypothetical protein